MRYTLNSAVLLTLQDFYEFIKLEIYLITIRNLKEDYWNTEAIYVIGQIQILLSNDKKGNSILFVYIFSSLLAENVRRYKTALIMSG